MTISEYTDTFLPQIASLYVEGAMPLHALVDLDLWRQVFPDSAPTSAQQFHWYEVSLTCNPLQDGTLLLSYTLPEPLAKGEAKYAAIRINPCARDARRAVVYTLRKPASIYDEWDIHYLPLPNQQGKLDVKFRCKIEGTDSLRNFVFAVQQIPFLDAEYDSSWKTRLKGFFGGALTPQ